MCFRFGSDPRESFLSSRESFAAGESFHSLVGGKANLQNDIGQNKSNGLDKWNESTVDDASGR